MTKKNNQKKSVQQTLSNTIWTLLTKIRGKMKTNDCMPYVFGLIFYKYLSEQIANNYNNSERENNPNYLFEKDSDKNFSKEEIEEYVKEKGYFICPSQLFQTLFQEVKKAQAENKVVPALGTKIDKIFKEIEKSSQGQSHAAENFRNLLVSNDLDFHAPYLGTTEAEKNKFIQELILLIGDNIPAVSENDVDVMGNLYEQLMTRFSAGSSTEQGEYFTVPSISRLVSLCAINGRKSIRKAYDPTCGTGGILIQLIRELGANKIGEFYGQELEPMTERAARRNLFLNNINPANFSIAWGDTLASPAFKNLVETNDEKDKEKGFDCIIANPPYSLEYNFSSNANFKTDKRFTGPGKLPSDSNADFGFTMHINYYLAEDGTAAIVNPLGSLYRDQDKAFRKYLIDNNRVDSIILLSKGLFYTTGIPTCVIVLKGSKSRKDDKILFVDASNEVQPWKDKVKGDGTKKTVEMYEENIQNIYKLYKDRKTVEGKAYLASKDEVIKNDYNLSVTNYAKPIIKKVIVDIEKLNNEAQAQYETNKILEKNLEKILKELQK